MARKLVSEALQASVYNSIGRYPKPVREIHKCVENDYGAITERQVYRALRKLVQEEVIVRDHPPGSWSAYWGYARNRNKSLQCSL